MSIIKVGLILVLNILFYNIGVADANNTLVTVKLGKVQGSFFTTYSGKKIYAFRGIPYAEQPIGELRFQPPEKLTNPWLQTFNATEDGPSCIQYDPLQKKVVGEENCLVLNVHTSEVPTAETKIINLPVLVFIHGGGFNFGTSNSLSYGPKKLLEHDVVLVTFNYRLNVLGFLSTQDETSPGNYGLLDQIMALKWVQENIVVFGGDPNKVTIFGESTGGASVSFHLLSELSSGLFKSAIVMSGPVLGSWAFDKKSSEKLKIFSNLTSCQKSNLTDIVKCLKRLSSFEIKEFVFKLRKITLTPFLPVIDGYFLKNDPITLYKSGQIANRVPLIYGKTKNEGLFFHAAIFGNIKSELSDLVIRKLVKSIYNIDDNIFLEHNVTNEITDRYFQYVNSTDLDLIQKKLIQIEAEGIMDAPFYYNLEFYLNAGMEPFVYSFDYVTNHSIAKLFDLEESEPTHMNDLYFLFDSPFLFPLDYTKPNDEHEKLFLNFWINFAKTNNPTPENYNNSIKWLPAKKEEINICHLDNPITLKTLDFDDEVVDFWMETFPAIMELSNKTM